MDELDIDQLIANRGAERRKSHRLNAEYFEAKLLKESERSVEWLLDQLKPKKSRKDCVIMQEITGYDFNGGGGEGVSSATGTSG